MMKILKILKVAEKILAIAADIATIVGFVILLATL